MTIITTLLHKFPVKIANSIVAHTILKSTLKNNNKYYEDVKLKYAVSIKMDLSKFDIGHQYLAFTGVYEDSLSKKITKIKDKKGGLMVDVGGNYGYYSLIWCGNKANNKAICFEASPKNFKAITNNINKNNLSNQITIETFAVSNQKGYIHFDVGPEEQTGWGGISIDNEGEHLVEVETTTLDDYFLDKSNNIEVLKVDTEGADYLVIKGALELLKNRKIQNIFWEENSYRAKKLGLQGGETSIFLINFGYKINQIGENEFHAFL